MEINDNTNIIKASVIKFREIVSEKGLMGSAITVSAKPLTTEEAIGNPIRRDYPLIEGRERIIEARFMGARGHAFTDSPQNFEGTLSEVLGLSDDTNQNRAIYLATLNAVLRHLGMVRGTVHCKDEEPETCARHIARHIKETWGNVRIGLVGLNPAIADALSRTFGSENVRITDRDRKNIGGEKYGITIWDGYTETEDLVKTSDLVLATGTTLGNGSFDMIWRLIRKYQKPYLFYGVTVAGISGLMGVERICPCGADA